MSDNINNLKFMIKDLLYGDESIEKREDYQNTTGEEVIQALDIILNNENLSDYQKKYFLNNMWRIQYKERPPTVDEFLTPTWIGQVADGLYDHVRDTVKDYMNPLNHKRVLALSTCVGFGKSSMSAIIAVYIIVHLFYMKNPKAYFNLNAMGSIVIALMSFTQLKANQLLLQPFKNLLQSSPKFVKVQREDRLDLKQKEIGNNKIVYTSAGRMGAFQFHGDFHITIASDRGDILGLNIILGILSEISFWVKEKGISIEEIWGAFSDMRNRVNNRFGRRYLSGVILDSSPLDLSLSPIDKWIYLGEAEKDPEVMIVKAKEWDIFPERFPKWFKTGKTFPVFRGNAGSPPKVLSYNEINEYNPQDILDVPIDKKLFFETGDLKRQVADSAGWPAGGLSKLIDDGRVVENIFVDNLMNVYDNIIAPANKNPEKLIWNQVDNKFFVNINGNYEFYRAPRAKRTLHIDLSESNDMAAIAMNHFELDKKTGENIIVNDFVIVISPEKSRINLDAVCDFILNLKNKARIDFYKITADQYQSSTLLQRLKRHGIDVDKLSVDREVTPYRVILSWILNEKVKVGKNIFLKNNLLSLIETTTPKGKVKIDHTKGRIVYRDNGNWKTSSMGINAKDASDAFTGSAYVLISELDNIIPRYIWQDKKSENNKQENIREKAEAEVIDDNLLKELSDKFNMQVLL